MAGSSRLRSDPGTLESVLTSLGMEAALRPLLPPVPVGAPDPNDGVPIVWDGAAKQLLLGPAFLGLNALLHPGPTNSDPASAAAAALVVGAAGLTVTLAPLGGGADDATRTETVYGACDGLYPVQHAAGAWHIDTNTDLPSNSVITWAPGATISGGMASTGGGNATNSLFRCFPASYPGGASQTALAAGCPAVVGSPIIWTDAAIPAGSVITISQSYLVHQYRVRNCGDAAPFRVELSEPMKRAFPAASLVTVWADAPHDIHVDFNGAEITAASGDDVLRFWFARNCSVRHVRVLSSAAFDGCLVAMDSGSVDCEISDSLIDLHPENWAAYEAAESIRGRFVRCTSHGPAVCAAFLFQSTLDTYIEDCHHEGPSFYGFFFRSVTAIPADALHGNLHPQMVNCTTRGTVSHGIILDRYTNGMQASGCVSEDAGVRLLDLDMQRVGTTDYTGTSAVLTKQIATPWGTYPRYLKVAPDGTGGGSGSARSTLALTIGRSYRVRIAVASDGVSDVYVELGAAILDHIDHSTTAWRIIDNVATANTDGKLTLMCLGDTGFAHIGPAIVEDVTETVGWVDPTTGTDGCGLYVCTYSTDNRFTDFVTARNAGYGVNVQDASSVWLDNWVSTDEHSGGLLHASTNTVKVANSRITNTRDGVAGLIVSAAGTLDVVNTYVAVSTDAATNAAGVYIADAASFTRLDDVTLVGDRGIWIVGTNGRVQVEGNLRMIGCAEPIVFSGGATQAQCNVGSATSNGAGALTIAFPQVLTNSTVRLYDGATGLPVASEPTITAGVSAAWAGLTINHLYYAQIL